MEPASQKIVMISNTLWSLYNFRYELICALAEKYQVILMAPAEAKDASRIEELKAIGCEVIDTPFQRRGKNPLADVSLYRMYLSLFQKKSPAAVLTFTIKPNSYAGMACRKLGIPYIGSVTGLGTAFQKNSPLKWVASFLLRNGLKDAESVFVQNEENRKILEDQKIIHGNEMMITGSGVNLEKFHEVPYTEECSKKFLYVGRLMKEKGAEEFLETAERMKKKYPETEFHMAGFYEDDYKERIQRREAEGILTYHGFRNQIQPLLQEAGCIIQPSHHEGMSNVCLEAAASARPIIVSDIPGCRETVEDGKTGYLFKVMDVEDLLQKTEKFYLLSLEEKQQMGKCGREKMLREFDRKKVIDAYVSEVVKAVEKYKGKERK